MTDSIQSQNMDDALISRQDLQEIVALIPRGAKILDLGCGSGRLLKALKTLRQAKVMGVELDQEKLIECVQLGVPVIQANLDGYLPEFADNSYDYIILSRTLQAVKRPDLLLQEMLRIGKVGIVSFMNFGQIEARLQILMGRMPVTKSLPLRWFETVNIHPATLSDFRDLCAEKGIRILKEMPISQKGDLFRPLMPLCPNLFASNCIFMISR